MCARCRLQYLMTRRRRTSKTSGTRSILRLLDVHFTPALQFKTSQRVGQYLHTVQIAKAAVRSRLHALRENASIHSVSDLFIFYFKKSMRNKWRSVSLSGSDEQKELNMKRVVDFFLPIPFQPFCHSLLPAYFRRNDYCFVCSQRERKREIRLRGQSRMEKGGKGQK